MLADIFVCDEKVCVFKGCSPSSGNRITHRGCGCSFLTSPHRLRQGFLVPILVILVFPGAPQQIQRCKLASKFRYVQGSTYYYNA